MIWLGHIYLVILAVWGATALLDDLKAKKWGTFAVTLIPVVTFLLATTGFLFLPRPGAPSGIVYAALALGAVLVIWDVARYIQDLRRTDPEFGTGAAVFTAITVAAVFSPALVLGILWVR